MQTFLRHRSSGQYFHSLERWTPERDNAFDFGIIARAMKFARKLALPDLEIVLSFDELNQITPAPFEDFWRSICVPKKRKALHSC
jgi:hypothetical protein